MSENHNFFGSAGVGGFLGAAIADGGLFNGNRNALTADQFMAGMNNMQNQNSTDALQSQMNGISTQICESTGAITSAVTNSGASVKDAVVNASALNQLALCELGHKTQAGFAQIEKTILLQSAEAQKLAIQQALDAERARSTELRIELSEHKNATGHQHTQFLIQQVNAGK